MSPITAEQAWAATDPSMSDDDRQAAAERMIAGVTANDAYLASRGEIERLTALSRGEQIVAHSDLNRDQGEIPTGEDTQTVDGTAEELPSLPEGATTDEASAESGSPNPDNETQAVATLRQQLQDAGITPNA